MVKEKLFSQLNLYYVVQKCLDKDVEMKCTVERVGASAVFLSYIMRQDSACRM